ncbi:hypothetical protein ONZ43_g2932 [Nemania bipapillata]|uniref:Uncharacterized protein n=1 Tax=Nemania bipapillata TaxID=110536 RepID=A0ACC2IYU9_9PEZI|nr:hypothetical protein ONZ43_g2932 [Nemania bipapillata]
MPRKKGNPRTRIHPKAKEHPSRHSRQRPDPASNLDTSPPRRPHGYTLAEEARNTASNRRGYRGRDARLRYQPVTFMSAGFMDPLKDFELPGQTNSSMQAKAAVPTLDVGDRLGRDTPSPAQLYAQSLGSNCTVQNEQGQCQYGHPDDKSDVASDSSDEVILFKGRNASRQQQKSPAPRTINSTGDSSQPALQHEINLELRSVREAKDITRNSHSLSRVEEREFIPFDSKPTRRPPSRKPYPGANEDADDEEAAIIADYIANMRDDSDDDNERDEGGEEEEEKEVNEEDINHSLVSHPFSVLRDLGGTDSDAVPSQPSSEDESGDESNEQDDEAEAEDGQRHIESEDERLARFIAKKEQLGLDDDDDDDDVLLFDGVDPDGGWIAATSIPRRKKKSASKKSRVFQGGSQFPSATKMAEAFDELDLMDMQNSRLKKSRKGHISFGLSDSELEGALNMAIKKDRLKKADKKKAREELRSQGSLGKNVNPYDLRVRYQGGMSLDDLADEIEAFMLSTREQLILPPFDKGARKIVHTIANSLNIKSKSAGAGTSRYPVLYRSKATLPYNETLFEQAFSRVRRVWFPRVDADEKVVQQTRVLKRTEIRAGKSRTGKSSLVLREGDIVGQHASEIGVENKGRAMLEKMGWSKGMSLGTIETKGITVPLTHVIKKSKAGLGDT